MKLGVLIMTQDGILTAEMKLYGTTDHRRM